MLAYFHQCEGCDKPILDFEIKESSGGKIVDSYCPTCQKKDPLVGLFCKRVKDSTMKIIQ